MKKIKQKQNNLPRNPKNKNNLKKTTSIPDNNSTLLKFFKLKSTVNSIQTNEKKPLIKENFINLNEEMKNNNKDKKKNDINNFINDNDENKNKIDISNFVLFDENFTEELNKIFKDNFVDDFKQYLEDNFIHDMKEFFYPHDLKISRFTFNKFIQQIFNHFITKYLLNNYSELIYVSKQFISENSFNNNLSELELLSLKHNSNILLEYLPINLTESKLFYPELSSEIVKFIKNFKLNRYKRKQNYALILYRQNNDFTSYINKIKLICNQRGFNLLIKEDEVNKLMTFEKLKLINQNNIIGCLKEKNKKYLQIIDNLSNTSKWKKFINSLKYVNKFDEMDELIYKNQIKSQSTRNSTKSSKITSLSKNMNQINENLSQNLLTYIGHNNEIKKNINNINSNEYIISKRYQQNILAKFNKRKNLILFLDNFEDNEENIKYINQINGIIPNSKSPIIILTNNISLFKNLLIKENSNYLIHQIKNEGITQKENVIYMTFLIIYFNSFFPLVEFEKENLEKNQNMDTDNIEKEKEVENELDFEINIKDDENEKNNENYDYNLEKIKKEINKIFNETDLKNNHNKIFKSLLILSYIISLKNQYELDNILVYLKNLFQLIDKQLKNIQTKKDSISTLSLIQNIVLKEIEEYKLEDNENEKDISKLFENYEEDSFNDYEYGFINNLGEKDYENKIKNYGINKGIDYNKESYFYLNEFFYTNKYKKTFPHISNKEINERKIEDHKFFHNYYTQSNSIFNYNDIKRINMILVQIIYNERIKLEETSRFIGLRFSKRKIDKNFDIINEKINILNRIFRKCPSDLFTRYINAHNSKKYYIEFNIDNKKYYIPEKLNFYNYYEDYNLVEQIKSGQKIKFSEIQSDDEDEDDNDNDLNTDEESELNEEEEY